MDILSRHEMFEIEVLDGLKSAKLLEHLVFGGGTMLRLCHELNRYSVDLDFWFARKVSQKALFDKLQAILARKYEITDAQMKRYTLLVELRAAGYPKRLKIEIRREEKDFEVRNTIAFSRFSTRQVLLRTHTLAQTMRNKVAALLNRGEVRDGFDIEFMLRRGAHLPPVSARDVKALRERVAGFSARDFKVKLGSIVDPDTRLYYTENRFAYLFERLQALSSPDRLT
jgi:predicted nucleotidyltransferase component of viral defense system